MTNETSPESHGHLPWLAIIAVVFALAVVGGVVAIAYSPVVAGLFPEESEEIGAPPRDKVEGAPAPDNTSTDYDPRFPAPDNSLTETQEQP